MGPLMVVMRTSPSSIKFPAAFTRTAYLPIRAWAAGLVTMQAVWISTLS